MNPPNQPTNTPRTDAECIQIYQEDVTGCSSAIDYVPASVARTLERELAAAKAECERLKFALVEWEAKERGWSKAVEKDADELSRLRAEVERLTKQIKDDNRSYGCELRDPNGTIWQQATKDRARAERAEAEIARMKLYFTGSPHRPPR
jgi:hypothetical protein